MCNAAYSPDSYKYRKSFLQMVWGIEVFTGVVLLQDIDGQGYNFIDCPGFTAFTGISAAAQSAMNADVGSFFNEAQRHITILPCNDVVPGGFDNSVTFLVFEAVFGNK